MELGSGVPEWIKREAMDRLVIGLQTLRKELISNCFDSALPLWSTAEVLSPLSCRKLEQVKVLFIDLQHSNLATAFSFQDSIWPFGL